MSSQANHSSAYSAYYMFFLTLVDGVPSNLCVGLPIGLLVRLRISFLTGVDFFPSDFLIGLLDGLLVDCASLLLHLSMAVPSAGLSDCSSDYVSLF